MDRAMNWSGERDTTAYFTAVAAAYAAYRPTYPREVFETMLAGLARPVHAVDIGCGTGISTRLLSDAGAAVIGIDPNAAMLEQAKQQQQQYQRPSTHRIEYRLGDAERTGLPDRSADLVLCAQSFHWFDPETALREFHRVLRSGGRLALLWNVRDVTDPFSAGYEANSQRAEDAAERDGRVVRRQREADATIGGHFGEVRRFSYPNPQPMTLDALLGRARSASYFPRHDPLRSQLEQELRELFNRHAANGMVTMQQRSELTLAIRT